VRVLHLEESRDAVPRNDLSRRSRRGHVAENPEDSGFGVLRGL
jgi:hypothetical protein